MTGMVLPFLGLCLILRNAVALEVHQLNDNWTVISQNQSIIVRNVVIPNGAYSVLEAAGFTKPVFESYNDVDLRWVARQNWTFETSFMSPAIGQDDHCALTFHGIDTMASVELNGRLLGHTDNMFVRYRYDVTDQLIRSTGANNTLIIKIANPIQTALDLSKKNTFTPPNCPPVGYNGECHMNFLRKMQASFAWDWGLAAPSSGIWKAVELEVYDAVMIRDVTIRLALQQDNVWHVSVKVYLESSPKLNRVEGELQVNFPAIANASISAKVNATVDSSNQFWQTVDLEIPASSIELWWPNGFGRQMLYDMVTKFIPVHEENNVTPKCLTNKTIRVGFRTINLIQEPISMGLSFYFEVNGHPMFMKGSNWIPSDVLPEKSASRDRIKFLLGAARDAHMNMLRVWGGGVYESDYFYEVADEYGILIWHDFMFACAMYPVYENFLHSVTVEVEQNVRRLQHHASIAIWATNNENEAALVQNWYGTKPEYERFKQEYHKLYIEVVKATAEQNDLWRICLSSSPSNGRYTDNVTFISANPQDNHYGDIHYYNYVADTWNWSTYPKPRFVSEYGVQSYPALSSWVASIGGDDYLPDLMRHRQHSPLGDVPIDALIVRHLPIQNVPKDRKTEATIYFSQIGQGMAIKTQTEYYRILRSSFANTMGALYWQLNDVWVAPSWSSIDYMGKFKILQFMAKKFLEPTSIVPIVDAADVLRLFLVEDRLEKGPDYVARMKVYSWKDFDVRQERTWNVSMIPNGVQQIDSIAMKTIFAKAALTREEHFLQFTLTSTVTAKVVSSNYIFPVSFKDARGVNNTTPPVRVTMRDAKCDGFVQRLVLDIRAPAPVIFFYLDVLDESIQGYTFSDNGFMIVDPVASVTVQYPNVDCDMRTPDVDHFRVYTVNEFMR